MALTIMDVLNIGVEKVDQQHAELVKRLNSIFDSQGKKVSKEEFAELIDFLAEYVVTHFGDEEALMEKSPAPALFKEMHKQQHEEFLAQFTELKRRFDADGMTLMVMHRINRLVTSWLVHHIAKTDKELGEYISGKKKR